MKFEKVVGQNFDLISLQVWASIVALALAGYAA
ncbi:hypothetical protein BH10BDE1_BH10BDE1_31050 [soil metagenome]